MLMFRIHIDDMALALCAFHASSDESAGPMLDLLALRVPFREPVSRLTNVTMLMQRVRGMAKHYHPFGTYHFIVGSQIRTPPHQKPPSIAQPSAAVQGAVNFMMLPTCSQACKAGDLLTCAPLLTM